MKKLIIVANRLPIRIKKVKDSFSLSPSPGGLASGLSSIEEPLEQTWIGWPGIQTEALNANSKKFVLDKCKELNCLPVFLTQEQLHDYYYGFSNGTIWPLFHYFYLYTEYKERYWKMYKKVNSHFCSEVLKVADEDSIIWIHDYQLMLLPELLRKKLPHNMIGFFLHIPFPSFEVFRLLPYRKDLLKGLLGADLIGFHTYDYVRHFLSSTSRILGMEHKMGEIHNGNRITKVDTFPMGIDYKKYAGAFKKAAVKKEIENLEQKTKNTKIILSVDRLDYTKGIIERLEAYDLFLDNFSEYREKITFVLLAVPSRIGVDAYKELREEIEQHVGRINGKYATIDWNPVSYLFRSLSFNKLIALYVRADIALITPLRDGMNLVAKEFVATKRDKGVLILSEMAGAASELGEALIVNANDKQEIARAIKTALDMKRNQQAERLKGMQKRLSHYTIQRWAHDFLYELSEIKTKQTGLLVRKLTAQVKEDLFEAYNQAKKRLILLDYDGTLRSFVADPDQARPTKKIMAILTKLSSNTHNELVIISGRNRTTIDSWLGILPVSLVAEHGAWFKINNHWKTRLPLQNEWKEKLKPIMEVFVDRTPGAFIEEKDFSLVWHYRQVSPELALVRKTELKDVLTKMTEKLGVGIHEGNRILEVKNQNINKGAAANHWLLSEKWDFVLGAGDDFTDEDLFDVLPENAFSIKVGYGSSKARFRIDSVEDMITLLEDLSKISG